MSGSTVEKDPQLHTPSDAGFEGESKKDVREV
jgi:hypothetical protein